MPRPVLVELVGAPGAGKSTVFAAMRAHDPAVVVRPILSRSPHAPRLYADVARLLGSLARRRALDRRWYPNLLAMTAELRTLPAVLDRRPGTAEVMVFDQGPIFTLTRPELMDPRLRDWWEATLARWARLLDFVVWLDADDDVLIDRIDTRAKTHRIKGADRPAAVEWLARDRALFGDVIARAEGAPSGPAVLRFDTGARSAEAVAADALAAIRAR